MPKISKPNAGDIQEASAAIYDMLVVAGAYKGAPKRPADYQWIEYDKQHCEQPMKSLVKILLTRTNLQASDADLFNEFLARMHYADRAARQIEEAGACFGVGSDTLKFKARKIVDYIAIFCATNKLYWNDAPFTDPEMEELAGSTDSNGTALGRALLKYGCFISQVQPVAKPNAAPAAGTTAPTSGMPAQSTTAPTGASGGKYGQSGGQVGNIPNAVTGQKVQLSTVYSIVADKIKTNEPKVYITPVIWDPRAGAIKQVTPQAASTIKFASANGWTDCVLYFNTQAAADAFKAQVEQLKVANQYNNIRVVQAKTDSNGYFEVSTALGNAYIRASKLNEELIETLLEADVDQQRASYNYDIQDLKAFANDVRNYN